jgi:crotonobetainyl-CoA hydratase
MVADSGGVLRVPRRLPRAIANELLLTGRRMDASEAKAWGLINQVVPVEELMQCAISMAHQIVECAPLSIGAVKEILRATESQSVVDAYRTLRSAPLPTYRAMLSSKDAVEGPRAFSEKRAPVWAGK